MSFQEEPESQIDFPLHQYTNKRSFSPPFDCGADRHAHHEQSPAHERDQPGSDDTIPDSNTAAISSLISAHEVLKSQVEDTQFIPVENDTQPSVNYDISPITRRVLDNIESTSPSLPPPVMAMPILERRDTPALSDGPGFRFGKPPNPNSMKLTRPLPGPNRPHKKEMTNAELFMPPEGNLPVTDRVAPSTTTRILPCYSGPPKGTFAYEKQLDSTLLSTQAEPTQFPGQETTKTSENNEVGSSRSAIQTIEHVTGARRIPEKASPRISRRPFEETIEPLNTTMHAQLLATAKSYSIADQHSRSPSQARRQAKSKSPPFVEAALSSNLRPNTIGILTAAICPESARCGSHGSGVLTTAEIQSSKPKCSEPCSVTKPFGPNDVQESLIPRNHPNQLGNAAQALPNHTIHGKFGHDDIPIPNRDLAESRNSLRDLPTNQRPRSRNKNLDVYTSKHGANELQPSRPLSRPLAEYQLQPPGIHGNQDLHGIRDSRVFKNGLLRSKTAHQIQSNSRMPIEGSKSIDSADMFHMAAVMATAEKEQREQVVARTRLQEVQIVDLSKKNAELQNRNEILSKENQELHNKHADYRIRCETYKVNMNEITRAQKELYAAAKVLDQKKFHVLKKAAQEKDAEELEAKALASEKSRAILKEARLKLDRQDKMIELLNRDINNQLLDLQRERGLKESLQKQLENREKQQEELKAVLLNHQQSTVALLSGHEDLLKGVLSAGADNALRLNECRALIKGLEENDPKPVPALIELNELVIALSARVEKKFQTAEESGIQVRNAGTEVLAALKNRLEVLNENHSAQQKLNATLTDLREANAMLKEKLHNRNAEFSGMERQFNDIKQELQECRAQLTATTDDLGKAIAASREDALLRNQLQDLQTSYSITKAQAESSASQAERVTADLREQEKLTMLAQEETSKLQDKLRQSEAKISAFDAQKKAYIRQLKDESNMQRLQMERGIQARLAEDETRHNDNISSLRRQIAEANNNLCHMKGKLQDMENMGSNREAETNRLADQVLAVTTELDTLQDEARLMEQNRDRRGSELRTSQEQLIRCINEAAEWSTRAEENALEFAKRCTEVADGFQKSEQVAEAEVNRLGALVLMLQKKNDDSDIVNSSVARYLCSRGLIKAGLTLAEWAVELTVKNSQQEETNLELSHPSVISALRNIPSVNPESNAHGSREDDQASAVSYSNGQIPVVVLDNTSTNLTGKYICHAADPSSALLDEGCKERLSEKDRSLLASYSMPSSKSIGRDISKHERHLGTRSMELSNASRALSNSSQIFLATGATPCSYLQASDDIDTSNIRLGGTKKLEGTAGTMTPDSQDESMQEQIPASMRPMRGVAERRHSTPHLREGKKTVTRTEFTEYSMQTSEMYDNMPTLQCNVKGGVHFSDPATNSKPVDSDVDSSGLSEPPDNMENVDFTEYLDGSDGNNHKDPDILRMSHKNAYTQSVTSHPAPSPKPNSSRVRTRARVQKNEIKQPKSILKRTDTAVRNDTSTDAHSNGKPLKITQPSKVQSIHGGDSSKGRLPRRSSGTNGIEGATHGSSYNRVVSGSRSTQCSSHFQASNAPPQVQGTSAADVFALSSSPAIGQSQRNSKKRVLARAGFSDSSRPIKLQRSARH